MKPGITDLFANFARDLRHRGLEFVSGRHYGKYAGAVVNTADPQGQGRVIVTCEQATGRTDALSVWAYPSADYAGNNHGLFLPPDEGDTVWVVFDHGDVTQPRYSGAYWGNTADPPTPAASEVPAEFQNTKTPPGPPTVRGLKTKGGLGWFFEDDDTTPLGRRFELWTGEQDQSSGPATRHHQFIMTDLSGDEHVAVESFGGQQTEWIDISGQEAIKSTTVGGLFVNLLDYAQKIVAGGPKGFLFTIDETGGLIEMQTPMGLFTKLIEGAQTITMGGPLGFSFSIDEQAGTITIQTPGGRVISLSDTSQMITVTDGENSATITPVGITVTSAALVNIIAAAALEMSAAAAATLTAAGPVALTGAGVTIQSLGGVPMVSLATGIANNTFIGLVTEEFLGALSQVITGVWSVVSGVINIAATTINIEGSTISIGQGGSEFTLMDTRLIALYNAHTHNTTAPGAPTGPPVVPLVDGQVNTTALRAN